MILKSLKYSQYTGTPNAWSLEGFELGHVNLVVGKNSTGKTKTLNVIKALADLVSGDQKLIFNSGSYEVYFNDTDNIQYFLSYENAKVKKEELIIETKEFLKRGDGGKGKIFASELNTDISFQSPENELACVTRRDSIQHPFFEKLYTWGKTTRHYCFGSSLGKDHLAVFIKKEKKDDLNLKDTNKVAAILKRGIDQYGDKMKKNIIADMNIIGYQLDDVGVCEIPGLIVESI